MKLNIFYNRAIDCSLEGLMKHMKGKSLGMWSWGQKQSSEDGKLGYVQWK